MNNFLEFVCTKCKLIYILMLKMLNKPKISHAKFPLQFSKDNVYRFSKYRINRKPIINLVTDTKHL